MDGRFEKGGKLYWLRSTVEAFESFLHVPGTVTRKGSHVRDAVDLKRVMIVALAAAVPCALFGMWNVGYQHALATGAAPSFWADFWFGFLKVLPLYVVSYAVGLAIEFASAQIRGEDSSYHSLCLWTYLCGCWQLRWHSPSSLQRKSSEAQE